MPWKVAVSIEEENNSKNQIKVLYKVLQTAGSRSDFQKSL